MRPDSDFFTAFITPHWNEAFNPNRYGFASRARVRTILFSRCPDLLDWYRDERGRPLSREQFAQLEEELSTWYGEEYGYQNDGKDRVSVATTCFESAQATGVPGSSVGPGADLRTQTVFRLQSSLERQGAIVRSSALDLSHPSVVDAFGRTPLWWAAKDGQLEEVESRLAQGADPNAVDFDRETPLHAAARWGRDAIVDVLLSHGANPSVSALYGTTPLHLSVQEAQVGTTRALLSYRAAANARDLFGDSPLHHAVARGNLELAALLLSVLAACAARAAYPTRGRRGRALRTYREAPAYSPAAAAGPIYHPGGQCRPGDAVANARAPVTRCAAARAHRVRCSGLEAQSGGQWSLPLGTSKSTPRVERLPRFDSIRSP